MSCFCYQGCRNGEHEVKDRKEGWPHPPDKASTCPLCLWFAGPPATVLGCFAKSKTKGWRETLPFAALLKSLQRGPKVTIAHTQWLLTLMKHRNNCKWCPQSEFIEKEKRSSHWQLVICLVFACAAQLFNNPGRFQCLAARSCCKFATTLIHSFASM